MTTKTLMLKSAISATLVLAWTASPDPVSHYNVYRFGELVGQTDQTYYIDRGGLWGCYAVSAVGESGLESALTEYVCHRHVGCEWVY